MAEKSFIELERAREAAIRCSPSLLSRLEALKEACKRLNISPAQKDAAKKISAALASRRLGIKPYHDDFELSFPTLSDCPQSVEPINKQHYEDMCRYIALSNDINRKRG